MKKWEYIRIQVKSTSVRDLDLTLPALGLKGWEVVSAFLAMDAPLPFSTSVNSYVHVILKREIN